MLRLTLRTLTVSRNVARTRWALMLLSASGTLPSSSPPPRMALRPVALSLARAKLRSLRHAPPSAERFVISGTHSGLFGGSTEGRYVVASIPAGDGLRRISVRLRWREGERWDEVVVADVADALPRPQTAR